MALINEKLNSKWLSKIYQREVKSNSATYFDCNYMQLNNTDTLILCDDFDNEDDAKEALRTFFAYVIKLMQTRAVGFSFYYTNESLPTGSVDFRSFIVYEALHDTSNATFTFYTVGPELLLTVTPYNNKFAIVLTF